MALPRFDIVFHATEAINSILATCLGFFNSPIISFACWSSARRDQGDGRRSDVSRDAFWGERTKDRDEAKAAEEELKELRNRMTEIAVILRQETATHGWVWGFIQKSDDQ